MSELQLAIHISRTSVHIAEMSRTGQNILRQYDFDLSEQDDAGCRKQLQQCFSELKLQDDYAECTLAWATPKQTLVPLRAFNESSAKSIFQFLFGENFDEQTIDFNRLMELMMVAVYEIPDWVKAFFVLKYPKTVIKHENAMTLRALFQGQTFKRKVVVSVNDDYITINVIYHNELTFSNTFEYQNSEDILYHLLFVIEKEKLQGKEEELLFLYASETTKKWVDQTMGLLEKHRQVKGKITASSIIKLQALCV